VACRTMYAYEGEANDSIVFGGCCIQQASCASRISIQILAHLRTRCAAFSPASAIRR
jgi:hypothetical protein